MDNLILKYFRWFEFSCVSFAKDYKSVDAIKKFKSHEINSNICTQITTNNLKHQKQIKSDFEIPSDQLFTFTARFAILKQRDRVL